MKIRWFSRGDLPAVLVVGALAAASALCLLFCFKSPATRAVITYPDGHEQVLSLFAASTVRIDGNAGHTAVVEVQNGRIRFASCTCPDQLCVHGGWLSHSGQSAVCVPAGVTVRLLGGSATVDGVTA